MKTKLNSRFGFFENFVLSFFDFISLSRRFDLSFSAVEGVDNVVKSFLVVQFQSPQFFFSILMTFVV